MILNQKIGRFIYLTQQTNIPGLIMSDPGIGKTSTVEMYCKVMDLNLTTLIASQYAPDDILGIQSVVDGQLVRLAPSWFKSLEEKSKNGKPNLLFIDELTTCDEFIQAPLLNLIFNKSLGSYKLPDNTHIVASGNYAEQLNHAFNLTAPLVNRFLILNLRSEDISVGELLNRDFQFVRDSMDVDHQKNFLGLTTSSQRIDLDKILDSIATYANFKVGIKNSSAEGLIGFTSVRSISYVVRYLTKAVELNYLHQDVWDAAADTLGTETTDESLDWKMIFHNLVNLDFARVKVPNLSNDQLEDYVKYLIAHPLEVTNTILEQLKLRTSNGDMNESLLRELISEITK